MSNKTAVTKATTTSVAQVVPFESFRGMGL